MDDTGGDDARGAKLYYHLTLLAETTAGYRNLVKLSSAAFLEGYYYKPRVDWELLEAYHGGLIATTGCLGGVVLQALLAGDQARALQLAGHLQDIFGRDQMFVELQDHGLSDQRRTNPQPAPCLLRSSPPTTATTAGDRMPRRTMPSSACRRVQRVTTRIASSSTARSTT
jgi:DNA polymerase-3 subunit alpha